MKSLYCVSGSARVFVLGFFCKITGFSVQIQTLNWNRVEKAVNNCTVNIITVIY